MLTCHEASDNEFNGQHLTLLHDGDIWVWNGKQSIRSDMLCTLHPPCACLIQDLPLHQYGFSWQVHRILCPMPLPVKSI